MARASLRFCTRVFMTVGRMATFIPSAELAADFGNVKNRADADEWIAGADEHAVGFANGFEDAWGGMRGFHTGKANSFHDRFGAALDEIFLKMEWAFV